MKINRYTYNDVKRIIEQEGYELLSTTYKNMHTKLNLEVN